jgi:hypothetical protein
MASDSLTKVREAAQKARRLGAPLDVIETERSPLEALR